jgi:hypothetical protein
MHKRLREFEEIHKMLREFEEIENSRQSCRGNCQFQEGKLLKNFSGFRPRIKPLEYQKTEKIELRCKTLMGYYPRKYTQAA